MDIAVRHDHTFTPQGEATVLLNLVEVPHPGAEAHPGRGHSPRGRDFDL
jgi:ligand-binding SRPBCC domain-containing protein